MMRFCLRRALISSMLGLAACASAQTQEKQVPAPAESPAFKAERSNPKKPAAKPSAPNPFKGFTHFSAILNGGIGNDHDRKIYRSGHLMRLEFGDSYRVTNLKTLWTFSVQPNKCDKVGFPDAGSYPFSAYDDFEVQREPTAETETVDGHKCTIENLSFHRAEPPVTIKMKACNAEDLQDFPIKIDVDLGEGRKLNTITYTNVKFETPDPKLFQVPAKCGTGTRLGQKGTIKLDPGAAPPKTPPKQK